MAKVLLIDDSAMPLALIERILIAGGHEVIATTSGSVALRQLKSAPIDVVVTDIYMPPPDGLEIIQAVRGLDHPIPVVVMSTNPVGCDVFRLARFLGAAATLQKPFTAEILLGAVSAALAGR